MGRAWSNTTNAKDSVNVYLTQADILKRVGKSEEALKFFEAGVKLQNREVRSSLKQPIETTQKQIPQPAPAPAEIAPQYAERHPIPVFWCIVIKLETIRERKRVSSLELSFSA